MKIKEYWRLAKISLKARKKTTRSTISGIAISLIIIVPLIFAMVGLSSTVLSQFNEHPENLAAVFTSAEEGANFKESTDYNENNLRYDAMSSYMGYITIKDHSNYFKEEKLDTINYKIGAKSAKDMNSGGSNNVLLCYERIIVDGKKYNLKREIKNDNYQPDTTNYMAILMDKEVTKLNNALTNMYYDGCAGGFTGDGQAQVILNENYLKQAGLTPKDVMGKKISVYFKDEVVDFNNYIKIGEEQLESVNHHLFKDFTVKGVVKENGFSKKDIRNAAMIFSRASYCDSQGIPYININYKTYEDNRYGNGVRTSYDYSKFNEYENLSNKYLFTGAENYTTKVFVSKGSMEKYEKKEIGNNMYLYVAKNYQTLANVINKAYKEYKNAFYDKDDFHNEVGSPAYAKFYTINKYFSIATIVGGIFAGVILFAALVNLFNTVKHSVDSRKNYLGVMKAIGARDNTIPKLYFFEVMRIFAIAYLDILIIGSAICIGIKLLIDFLMKNVTIDITLAIGWEMLPIVMSVLLVILFVIGFIYSYGCAYKLSKQPITTLLEG